MDTTFMNYENSKASAPRRILLNLSDKVNLNRSDRCVALSNLSIYHAWKKKIKGSYKKNNFKISAPTWNEEFELPDGSYSVSDIQDYFKHILKKHETVTDNPSKMIHIDKIEKRIMFKIKTGYYLERFTTEIMKLLGSSKNRITKNENGENVPHLEITEVVLIHCNIVSNNYQ